MSELNDESPLRLAVGDVTAQRVGPGRRGRPAPHEAAVDDPAQVWSALARTTVEGLIVPPLGTAERAAGRTLPVELPRSDVRRAGMSGRPCSTPTPRRLAPRP